MRKMECVKLGKIWVKCRQFVYIYFSFSSRHLIMYLGETKNSVQKEIPLYTGNNEERRTGNRKFPRRKNVKINDGKSST
jgi:hypothetical protein